MSTEDLIESRHRLLDAYGTLSFLLDDILRSSTNPTGLQSTTVLESVQNLKETLAQLIGLLSSLIEKSDDRDFHGSLVDVAYATPVIHSQEGPGRKRWDISQDQIEHLRGFFFSWEKIASILRVSISTLQRRRREFGLGDKFETYSEISDDELDEIYRNITGSSSSGPITPNIGRRRFIGALRSRGLRVQRWRVTDCLRRLDPVRTALRWRMTIRRRKYYVPTPNSLWHIDSAHKLIRYKLIVHVCVDGKTRTIIYVSCSNNKAETVLALFQNAVQKWGLPSRVRSDYGMENLYVAACMIEQRGTDRGSIITGSSVHNSRVERTHCDVYSGVFVFYARLFDELEEGVLDVLNEIHIFSLHHVYIPRINNSFVGFVSQMNNRPVSSERNRSPLQMWEQGMLENMYSQHTATTLPEGEIEDFGVDPSGVLTVEEDDYRVNVTAPSLGLSDEQIAQLPNPMSNDQNGGKSLYLWCVELVTSFLNT